MSVVKRLKCIQSIPPGVTQHKGPHIHSLDKKVVHFCETKYAYQVFRTNLFF